MSGMPWFKHYANKRNDPRVHLLTLPSSAIYYRLSEVAAQCDFKGAFVMSGIQLTVDQLAQLINVDPVDLKRAMREMNKTGLMSANGHGPYLTDFAHEQTPQDVRRQQWRERKDRERVTPEMSEVVTRDKKRDVTRIEERVRGESQSQRIESESLLLLLSEADRELVKAKHPGWIAEAISLAHKAEKPRPSYAAGILKNWIHEGRNKNAKPANSHRPGAKQNQPAKATDPASDRDAAARILARRKAKANV